MADEVGAPTRVYFSVLDESGEEFPAVEYWAGSADDDAPAFQVVRLRRFIKLLGAGEPLDDTGRGTFIGLRSGRRFFLRVRTAETLAAQA